MSRVGIKQVGDGRRRLTRMTALVAPKVSPLALGRWGIWRDIDGGQEERCLLEVVGNEKRTGIRQSGQKNVRPGYQLDCRLKGLVGE